MAQCQCVWTTSTLQCAAITQNGILHHHQHFGPLTVMDAIQAILVPDHQTQDQV